MEHSTLQTLIENYGYIVVFVGTLLEGETVLIMAGFAANRGYLDLFWVIVVAALGGFIGDQCFFALGRFRGWQVLSRFPSVQRHAAWVDDLIHRHSTLLIPGVRFMYGLRVAGPVLIGMSRVSHVKFAVLNFIGAVIWAAVGAGAGYAFGQAVAMMLHNARRYELALLAGIAVAGILVWAVRKARRRPRTERRA